MITSNFSNHKHLSQYLSRSLNTKIDIFLHKKEEAKTQSEMSRYALWQLLTRHRIGCRHKAKSMRFPQKNFSVSHSGNLGIAVMGLDKHIQGIGVDFEPKAQLKPSGIALYTTCHERKKLNKPISRQLATRLWTIKEAIHKSNPNNRSVGWLSAYKLPNPKRHSGFATLKKFKPKYFFRYTSIEISGGILSIAITILRKYL